MEHGMMACGLILICVLGVGGFRLAAAEMERPFEWKPCLVMIVGNLLLLVIWRAVYAQGTIPTLRCLVLATLLGICAWTDFREYLILNRVLLAGILLRLLLFGMEFFVYGANEAKYLVLSSGIAAIMFLLGGFLCKAVAPKGVGFGDIKLLFLMGLFAGTDLGVQVIVDTFLVMFVVIVVLLLTRRVNRKSMVPFAPFLYAGMLIATFCVGL